jgi:hypothetical protein
MNPQRAVLTPTSFIPVVPVAGEARSAAYRALSQMMIASADGVGQSVS